MTPNKIILLHELLNEYYMEVRFDETIRHRTLDAIRLTKNTVSKRLPGARKKMYARKRETGADLPQNAVEVTHQ